MHEALHQSRPRVRIALDGLDFGYTDDEGARVKRWYEDGVSLADMAQRLARDRDEVAIILMDLSRRNLIKPRPSGYIGGRMAAGD